MDTSIQNLRLGYTASVQLLHNGNPISHDFKICHTVVEKSLGLLSPHNPRYLLIKTHFGIHTFGLKNPIDVLVLDRKHRVQSLCKDLKPNRFYFYNPIYKLVVEMPSGTIEHFDIKQNDNIDWW